MDQALLGVMEILGPIVLMIVLVGLVMRTRSNTTTRETEQATHDLYNEEEQRRREGSDKL